jgi:DNA-binding LacI/PurR family transcriptional regulator
VVQRGSDAAVDRAVTIKDVARLSGVSTATVTRALRGHPRVLPETRRRVAEAARILEYRPHSLAQALATGASQTIGLLLPSTGDRFWGEVAFGVEERAAEEDLSVLLANSHALPARAERMLDLFLTKRVEGVIVTAGAGLVDLGRRARGAAPTVFIDWDAAVDAGTLEAAGTLPPRTALDLVRARTRPEAEVLFDHAGAAAAVVRHLLELGHERLAFIGVGERESGVLRLIGFRLALEEEGLAPNALEHSDGSLEGGRRAAERLLGRHEAPTGIVAYDDLVAIGAMRTTHALGLRVPADVSIVGCDDIDVAAFVEPPLTTVRPPKRELGRRAVSLLLEQRAGGAPRSYEPLPGELVVRDSTGPRP